MPKTPPSSDSTDPLDLPEEYFISFDTYGLQDPTWREELTLAIEHMLQDPAIQPHVPLVHRLDTPSRVVKAYEEFFSGCSQDPSAALSAHFEEATYSEMIHVEKIDFTSFCMHHLLPFTGKVHFAYVPDKKIVGLSKIPRMIAILSARPQVQERLTDQIGQVFQDTVAPKGCGVMLYDVVHACSTVRGVKQAHATMRTTALFGCFKKQSSKMEFLNGR